MILEPFSEPRAVESVADAIKVALNFNGGKKMEMELLAKLASFNESEIARLGRELDALSATVKQLKTTGRAE